MRPNAGYISPRQLCFSGDIASGQVGSVHIASGTVVAADVGSGAVGSGAIQSGAVQGFFGSTRHVASGTLGNVDMGSGAILSGAIASGNVWGLVGSLPHIASGSFTGFELGSGSVVSGRVASGQIGNFHVASGQVQGLAGAGVPNLASGTVNADNLGSGSVLSGHIGSGAVWGLVGSLPHILSGTLTGFELGSGAVVSGRVASGQIGNFHIASGQVQGLAGAGVPNLASGTVNANNLGSGSVLSGHIGSGAVWGLVGALPHVLSGTLNGFELGSGAVVSGRIASGQLGRFHFASGTVIDLFFCEQNISGIRAVTWGSGGCFIVPADRSSGLRFPAIGVVAGNFVSGDLVPVVRRGVVSTSVSGTMPSSGFWNRYLYVGSGGLIISQSGFVDGASSGHGAAPTPAGSGYSGALVQRIGISMSGGIDVCMGEITSGLFSGFLGQY